MNERERLIEKLYEWGNKENDGVRAESIADYLLEKGVIVPPVKVGDTVYGISRGVIIPIGIDRIQYSNRGVDIIGRNEKCFGYGTITLDPNNKIGMEWYKTEEQAEKALKGGAK
jgi:hypothetical protein